MKYMLALLSLGYVASAPSLPVNPGGIGGLFKGPNSETIIKGPDGSIITSAAEGGQVNTKLEPLVVVEDVLPVIETVAVPIPAVETKQSSDLIGPSGRIVTEGSKSVVAGPASTTITGPAVVAKTVVKGTPVVVPVTATPIVVTAAPQLIPSPVASIDGATAGGIAVTASPVPTIHSTASPLPVIPSTASPLVPSSVTPFATSGVSVGINDRVDLGPISHGVAINGLVGTDRIDLGPVISSTPSTIAPVATNRIETNDRVDIGPAFSVTPSNAAIGIQRVALNGDGQLILGQLAVNNRQLLLNPSNLTPTHGVTVNGPVGTHRIDLGPVVTSTIAPVATNRIWANDKVDIGPAFSVTPTAAANGFVETNDQLIHDQLAIDNRQLLLNPAQIPAANIIPPEIAPTPKSVTPGTLLTTPGLGTAATSPNVLKQAENIDVNVTPNYPQYALSPQQVTALQSQVLALQNQRQLNNQIQYVQNTGPALFTPTEEPEEVRPSEDPRTSIAGAQLTPEPNVPRQNVVQQAGPVGTQLAKAGIDASQLQLTNVPLSDVTGLPRVTKGVISSGFGGFGRYGRQIQKEKKKN